MMDKETRDALLALAEMVENARCENLHHPKKWRHEAGFMCPAEYAMARRAYLARRLVAEYQKWLDQCQKGVNNSKA